MFYLLLSFLVLAIAPLIEWFCRGKATLEAGLNSFVFVVLAGLVLGDIIPHSLHAIGWFAIPLILLGLCGPSLLEMLFAKFAETTHQGTLVIATCGLLLHAMIDGALLNDYAHIAASDWLPIAILLHRLPLALMICFLLKPLIGSRGAYLGLFAIAVFTMFGFLLGIQLEPMITSDSFALLQSFVAGTLLHVLMHQPHIHKVKPSTTDNDAVHHHSIKQRLSNFSTAHVIGGGLAVSLLALMSNIHHH